MSEDKDTSSATWKFEFFSTVNADPQANGVCLGVIVEFLNFCSKSDPKAFRSLSDLMLATGSARPTVKRAIKTLVRLKYLQALYLTEGGAMMYRLVNARKDEIDMHKQIAKETRNRERADRKKLERRAKGEKETCPPKSSESERFVPPEVKESYPNTVEELRRVSFNEGNDESLKHIPPSNDNLYGLIDDDPTVPFGIPEDDAEADQILSHFGTLNPTIRGALRRMLMAGQLTPALLSANLGGEHG